MIESLSRLAEAGSATRPRKHGRGRVLKLHRPLPTESIDDIEGANEEQLQSREEQRLSARRVRQLAREARNRTSFDLDAVWNAYLAVHADPAALRQVPASVFAAVRDLMHQTVDVLGLRAAASRVCLVSADQEKTGAAMDDADHTIHMWGLYQLQRFNEIEAKFDELFARSKAPLSGDIWHFRLTALLRANKLERMMEASRSRYAVEQRSLDACTAASLLVHLLRKNEARRAIALLHQMHPLPEQLLPKELTFEEPLAFNLADSVFAHNTLLAEFAKQGHIAIAQWFLTRMRKEHIAALPFSITAMMHAIAQSKKATTAMLQVLFAEITSLCADLDVVGYNVFTHHFMIRGNKDEAYAVLNRMREANVYPDEHTFSILVHACVKQNDWMAARTLLGQMRALKLTPSADLYGIILGGHARNRDIDGMKATLHEMEQNGVAQSLAVWNCALSLVARAGNLPGALHVFRCIRKLRLSPDQYTYWWVFYAYRWTICRVQRDFKRTQYAPQSLDTYNITDNELELPFTLLAEMKAANIPIDKKLAYLINFVLYRVSQLRKLQTNHIDMNMIAESKST
ncbi:hypothetical protein SYNPS1DRAFT_23633 [Syncephalis pseudoplumigaleata]|uniref:Pentacotripeptide-repeat region of PRORP domain-containing protein n=1 Tax=Syncephalis pseudoplumigaleata TaxID=1712513 RepID=A0A4P9YXL7_9FUNG|nr:hypothetical protein SYNPS1DRAFT_23633 [Syncephalis pseudoplumigaleata]|eukprot:RKP24272.1 hypothetical protein SYNPS1DRAFT_23633 [Syncephalis pseudoplumigaleata]